MYTLNNAIRHWKEKEYQFSTCSGTSSAFALFKYDKYAKAVVREAKRDPSLTKRIYVLFNACLNRDKWASQEPTSEIIVTFLYLVLMQVGYRQEEISRIAYQSRFIFEGYWILHNLGFKYLDKNNGFS